MAKTLVTIALWALGSWLIGSWLGTASGWATMTFGLLLMVLVSAIQLSKISTWVLKIDEPPPPSVGPWDEILAPIYRKLKSNRQLIQEQSRNLKRLLLAAEAMPDGALTLDADKNLQWCNQTAASHLGLNLDQDRGHNILNIVRDPEFVAYAMQASWEKPLIMQYGRGNNIRILMLHMAPYGIRQFLLVSRDITQIERLENTRKDFVANVSHEMRTPLTVLTGFVETLLDMTDEELDRSQQRHFLELMAQQAQNMQAIVEDLLTLSSLESTPSAKAEKVIIADICAQAITQGKALSNQQHIFHTNIDQELCILGKNTELASAITNLISNAVRYTPAGGNISVNWNLQTDGSAKLSVIDTGIGIDITDIPRLTERFFRVNRGRSRATGGTGLGLAIAKHVAKRHNADLTITSEPGQGSEFSIIFAPDRVYKEQTKL